MNRNIEEFIDKDININIDEDGIMSAIILNMCYGKHIGGFNNNDTVVIVEEDKGIRDNIYIDLHVGYEDIKSIDQHCVAVDKIHLKQLQNNENKMNPNIEYGISWNNFTDKFCYSTTIYLIAKIEGEGYDFKDIDLYKEVDDGITLGDLLWYTDSSYLSWFKYNRNASNWNKILIELSHNGDFTNKLLDYLIKGIPQEYLALDKFKTDMTFFFKKKFGCSNNHGGMKGEYIDENGYLLPQMLHYLETMHSYFECNATYLNDKKFKKIEGLKSKAFKYQDYEDRFDSTKLFSYGLIWGKYRNDRNNIRATYE